MEDFSLRLQMLISKVKSHGITIDEEEAVSKFLHSVPVKYIQIALSIERCWTCPPSPSRMWQAVCGRWTSAWSRRQ